MLEVVSISDEQTGAVAEFLPGRGFNCCSARLPVAGRLLEAIWCPAGFREVDARASSGGVPILCPYPGRLASTTMEFEGAAYELEPAEQFGRPIHGFVHDRAWQVLEQGASSVTAAFRLSRDAPERLHRWPADFELEAQWRIDGGQLTGNFTLTALGRMPAALGLHPYFPIPLIAAGTADACELDVPTRLWQPQQDLLPVGPLEPASARAPFPGRVPLAGLAFDDAFTGLDAGEKVGEVPQVVTAVVDPAAGISVELAFDPTFSACVLFTPPHREAVCIEPYTVLPGAASFDAARGWKVLEAGGSITAMVRLSLEPVRPEA